jgi:hypothetical protein
MNVLGPARNGNIDKMNLLAVASVQGHPQADLLQALHAHVVSHGWLDNSWKRTLHYLLTHREVYLGLINLDITGFADQTTQKWLEGFPQLIQYYDKYITLLSKISVIRHPLEVQSFTSCRGFTTQPNLTCTGGSINNSLT